jgi:hypothetical protein
MLHFENETLDLSADETLPNDPVFKGIFTCHTELGDGWPIHNVAGRFFTIPPPLSPPLPNLPLSKPPPHLTPFFFPSLRKYKKKPVEPIN